MSRNADNVYKKVTFEKFITLFQEPTVIAHWKEIAEALGVNKNTITRWSKHPLAIEARQKGIDEALFKMQYAGAKDWKMWESKLKMLGLAPIDKSEIKQDVHVIVTEGK